MFFYFPDYYEDDLAAYKKLGHTCMCGGVIDDIIKNHSDKILHLSLFYVHNLMLIVFSEAIEKYFPEYYPAWRKECYDYINYDCTNNKSRMFWAQYTKKRTYKGESLSVSSAIYMKASCDVIKYVDQKLQQPQFDGLDVKMVQAVIIDNDDCPEGIRLIVDDKNLDYLNDNNK